MAGIDMGEHRSDRRGRVAPTRSAEATRRIAPFRALRRRAGGVPPACRLSVSVSAVVTA